MSDSFAINLIKHQIKSTLSTVGHGALVVLKAPYTVPKSIIKGVFGLIQKAAKEASKAESFMGHKIVEVMMKSNPLSKAALAYVFGKKKTEETTPLLSKTVYAGWKNETQQEFNKVISELVKKVKQEQSVGENSV